MEPPTGHQEVCFKSHKSSASKDTKKPKGYWQIQRQKLRNITISKYGPWYIITWKNKTYFNTKIDIRFNC